MEIIDSTAFVTTVWCYLCKKHQHSLQRDVRIRVIAKTNMETYCEGTHIYSLWPKIKLHAKRPLFKNLPPVPVFDIQILTKLTGYEWFSNSIIKQLSLFTQQLLLFIPEELYRSLFYHSSWALQKSDLKLFCKFQKQIPGILKLVRYYAVIISRCGKLPCKHGGKRCSLLWQKRQKSSKILMDRLIKVDEKTSVSNIIHVRNI